tara:strand:+ start:80 stop:487 length:408 start_codon:yes stop_codon:yes gene_type:complete
MSHYDDQRLESQVELKSGRPEHEPTKALRDTVSMHAMVGTNQVDIASVLDIDPKTLRKHYRSELTLAVAKANATIGGALFNKAKSGDTGAMIFWMKARAGFKETNIVQNENKKVKTFSDMYDNGPAEDNDDEWED